MVLGSGNWSWGTGPGRLILGLFWVLGIGLVLVLIWVLAAGLGLCLGELVLSFYWSWRTCSSFGICAGSGLGLVLFWSWGTCSCFATWARSVFWVGHQCWSLWGLVRVLFWVLRNWSWCDLENSTCSWWPGLGFRHLLFQGQIMIKSWSGSCEFGFVSWELCSLTGSSLGISSLGLDVNLGFSCIYFYLCGICLRYW